MTLEELKSKKVTVTANTTLSLLEDLGEEILKDFIKEQKDENYSDEELIDNIIYNYYNAKDDLDLVLDDYNVSVHD